MIYSATTLRRSKLLDEDYLLAQKGTELDIDHLRHVLDGNVRQQTSLTSGQPSPPACPVCDKVETRLLFEVTSSDAAQRCILREGNEEAHQRLVDQLEDLWSGPKSEIWECAACEFVFAHPYVAGDAEFYTLAFPRVGYPRHKWEYERTIAALEGRGPEARILEIGSGEGHFLDKISPRFFKRENVFCTEYHPDAVSVLCAKGYRVFSCGIEEAPLAPASFEAIFLFQVVQCMDGLDALFLRLHALLRPGGSLFIAVPNPLRVAYNETTRSLTPAPPIHIGRWKPASFRAIAARTGLKVEAIEVEPFSFRTFAQMDIAYYYLRQSQQTGTLANSVRSRKATKWRRLLEGGAALVYAPARMVLWARRRPELSQLGVSLWAKLRKPEAV